MADIYCEPGTVLDEYDVRASYSTLKHFLIKEADLKTSKDDIFPYVNDGFITAPKVSQLFVYKQMFVVNGLTSSFYTYDHLIQVIGKKSSEMELSEIISQLKSAAGDLYQHYWFDFRNEDFAIKGTEKNIFDKLLLR
ncbi:MAG: hypothetical protein ABIC91_05235 [Nanoarchaeota archaeon]|nr:hypothetical protein [Nanoarchaeota archaeon]MBU1030785.1 hypothetical protein [Nanoarchaeota archaeon]MBU1849977.1 hypothetical protein [Nanoarchaeota archaeon]